MFTQWEATIRTTRDGHEYSFTNESRAHEAYAQATRGGWPVSLLAYDPERDAYVFSITD